MEEKIIRFLKDAGYENTSGEPAAMQLIRYFEDTYGVSLMALLEREWMEDQLNKDSAHYDFKTLRDVLDPQYVEDFDDTIARIGTYDA